MSGAGAPGRVPLSAVDSVLELVGQNPLLAGALAVALVVLLVVLFAVVRYLRRTNAEKLRRTLRSTDEIAVLMHPNPDPDAMSCALAVAEMAEATDTAATIQYPGQIRHQENRAFQTVLDLDFDRVEHARDLAAGAVVLVDHNTPRGFTGAEGVEPVAVIDHHPGAGTGTEFTDIRTENGACATIFAEYFRRLDWDPLDPEAYAHVEDGEGVLPPGISTGLLYGIQADTKHLTKGCSAAEFEAAAYLYQGVDEDQLDRIANPEVDAEVLDVRARAIAEREVRNAFAVSDVGEVDNVDAVPQAADELLRLEGVTAVVVVGEKAGTLHLSGRSRDDRVHMGRTLRDAVDTIPMADAGGHARMGGGQVSIDHMEGLGPAEGFSREDFVDRLFAAMSGEL